MSESILPVAIIGGGLGGSPLLSPCKLSSDVTIIRSLKCPMASEALGLKIRIRAVHVTSLAIGIPCPPNSTPNGRNYFSGKKVAVIGNGCSATQIVPKLAEDSSTSIVEFSPSHCSRVGKMDIPEYAMDTKSLPLDDCCEMDMTYLNWKVGPFTSMLRRQREKACIERIKRLTPEKYHENLIPKFRPNTATGHGSVIHSEEVQLRAQGNATKAYNDRLQEELKHTVWTSCISWYHAGEGRRGKLMTWPATQTYMWWMMRTPIWRDYDTTGGEKWLKRRQYASAAQTTLEWLLIGAGLGTFALMKLGKWEYTKQLIVNNASGLIKGP
ncbi:hypothetical protein RhiXN_03668 [Rhizoctonia solani]|uniref:Uncharacterized protein n=1 Tax=Rhizoctonia solani TaxID=456999 RepID=A0A8H8NN36_9AGAM|nr:uncharacterized protein RhiXN_03668 [Rhizoctonia solani]QRW15667.1 hypothetical protein RhiXN_03668 [Rhizoctonia solani]